MGERLGYREIESTGERGRDEERKQERDSGSESWGEKGSVRDRES